MKNFLKPDRYSHKDPQVRLAAVAEMDNDDIEHQRVLESLATEDTDSSVRQAAIARLESVPVLVLLLQNNSGEETYAAIATAAENRLAAKLASDELNDTDAGLLLTSGVTRHLLLTAIHCANVEHRNRAIEQLVEEAALLDIVQQSRYHDSRFAAASKLKNHDQMRAALAACRSRDKVVAKMLQQQLDEKAAAEAEEIAAVHAVSTTVQSMQALAGSVWSPQHAGKFAALNARWDSFDDAHKSDAAKNYNTAAAAVQGLLDMHAASHGENPAQAEAGENRQDAKDATEAETRAETRSETPAVLVDDPEVTALLALLSDKAITDVADCVAGHKVSAGSPAEKLHAHASAVAVLFDPPFEVQKGRPGAVEQRIKRVGTLLDTGIMLPGIAVDACQYIKELQEHHGALENRLDKAQQESRDRIKATHRQFSSLSGTISDGKWGPANSMFRRLQKKVAAMEPAERASLGDKLERAEKQLDEMADWQDFAARPKLEALCEQMEALPGKSLKPDALAKEVKAVQAQWKTLGVSRASNELWSRFKTAGDTAYEPCKAYFEQKQSERDVKLKAKSELCDKLGEYYKTVDWEEPDWKAVQREVSNAKRDWSRNRITDRKPDKALEKRFSDALKPLEDKLAEQYDLNAAAKQDLVEKVAKLAEGEINQHSVNQAKRLQSAWKQVGIMRRKDDQALWETFNGHCRTVHKHQHSVEREKYQASMSHVFRARDIIKTLRQLGKSKTVDDQQVQALQSEFQSLAEFPDKDKKFLLRDFRGALDAVSRSQETASRRRQAAEHDEVLRLVGLCEQLETAVESGTDNKDALIAETADAWEASDASVNRELANALFKRRKAAETHLGNGTDYDFDAAEKRRRELLIRMEIVAEKETPAEDKALRMQYQLAHLSEGMTSSAIVDKRSALAELEIEWHTAAPARQSVRDALHSRYLNANGK